MALRAELNLTAVTEPAEDPDVLLTQVDGLRADLLDLDVARVGTRSMGPAPQGTRGHAVDTIGALAVALEPTIPLLTEMVRVVRDWLGRTGRRTAVLEIDGHRLEVTGVDGPEQRRLADAWLAAVTADRP